MEELLMYRRHRSKFSLLLIAALMFMLVGDRLPEPVGSFSAQTKQTVNGFIIGLFPSWNPDLNPNERTESQLKKTETSP